MQILVVDSEAEIQLLFFVAADQVGCDVSFAMSGKDALAQLGGCQNIDLIFCATQLEDIAPREFAKQLRGLTHYTFQPLVFFSASDETADLVALLEFADDVILKPFSQQVLLAKILSYKRIRSLYKALHTQNAELKRFRKRTENELSIASDVFQQLTAKSLQNIPGLSSYVSPYSVFNGDLLLFASGPQQTLYFLVADVTGHGLSAALGSIPCAEHFLGLALQGLAVGQIARTLNHIHLSRVPPYILCAAIIGCFDVRARCVRYWSGGMPPMLVVDEKGQVRQSCSSLHMAIGACDDQEFEADESMLYLQSGDRLICYTDGVIETSNPQGEFWGVEGLTDAAADVGSDNLLDSIVRGMAAFRCTSQPVSDDVSLFCLDADRVSLPDSSSPATSTPAFPLQPATEATESPVSSFPIFPNPAG